MARLATAPSPNWLRCSPTTTPYPSAPPPTSPATITTASTITMPWLTPSMMAGRASGILTFQRSRLPGRAERGRRLDRGGRDLAQADGDEPDHDRDRVRHGCDDARHPADVEERNDRNQVHELRQRLQRVEHGSQDALDAWALGRPDAHRESDQQGQQGRDDHLRGRIHRRLPHPHDSDRREQHAGGDRLAGARHDQGDRGHAADDEPPGRPDEEHAQGLEPVGHDPVAERVRDGIDHAIRVLHRLDRVVDGAGDPAVAEARLVDRARDRDVVGEDAADAGRAGDQCARDDRGERPEREQPLAPLLLARQHVVSGRVGAVARGLGGTVERDRHDHDREARDHRLADVEVGEGADHRVAQAAAADQGGDDNHREGHHDRLVDAEHDRPAGERQLHPGQHLQAGRAERIGGLHRLVLDAADAERGDPYGRRHGVDHRRDDRGRVPDREQDHDRHQVRERGHDLHGVEHRGDQLLNRVAAAGEHPERDADRKRYEHRRRHQRQRLHALLPQAHEAEGGERREHEPGRPASHRSAR